MLMSEENPPKLQSYTGHGHCFTVDGVAHDEHVYLFVINQRTRKDALRVATEFMHSFRRKFDVAEES